MTKRGKRFRVLLLSPPYPHLGGGELFGLSGRDEWFPLGVFAIANAICLEETADVHIYYKPDYTPATLEAVIRKYAPDIVGITCFTHTRFACFELAAIVKQVNKNIKVLLGGVHATFLDQQIMAHYPCVDMIIRGYAEGAFLDVIKSVLNKAGLGRIAGLTWRDGDNKTRRNSNRFLENDLVRELACDIKSLFIDGLPAWKSMEMILFSMPVETARGCVYTCFFCSRFGTEDRTVVQREPAQALRYVQGLFELFGRRQVYFCDNNFTLDRKRVFEFCDLLRSLPFELEWTCSTRVDLVDKELLCAMKRAGCRKLYYGVDSLCQRVLTSIGRHFAPELAVKNLNLTVACGLQAEANVIIGFPGENAASVMETYSYRKRLHPSVGMVLRPLSIMPGGLLYHHALKNGFQEDYWLKDHGPEFPVYTGAMPEKRIMEYCCFLRNPKNYVAGREKSLQKI
ncbi:MAG: cobalamin-dependent protein [Candidatus Omnitrophica bacterium]|nr:cobalamin-dependent protein [Candidatus Omnitrophota bacterium]